MKKNLIAPGTRPKVIEAANVILAGTFTEKIVSETNKLLKDKNHYETMSKKHNPYGDEKACARIIKFVALKAQT